MPKKLTVAYLMWFTGGFLGLHHLYLGRDVHFFVSFTSAGWLGIGTLVDFSRIPRYVARSNHCPSYLDTWLSHRGGVQETQLQRWLGALVLYTMYTRVVDLAFQDFLPPKALLAVVALARALAVVLVFSIEEKEVRRPWLVLLVALISQLTLSLFRGSVHSIIWYLLEAVAFLAVSIVAFRYQRYRGPRKLHPLVRVALVLCFCSSWMLLIALSAYKCGSVPVALRENELRWERISDLVAFPLRQVFLTLHQFLDDTLPNMVDSYNAGGFQDLLRYVEQAISQRILS